MVASPTYMGTAMTTILQLNASLFGADSQSTRLATEFVDTLRERHGGDVTVLRRDLGEDPVPHLTAERFRAFGTAPAQRIPEQTKMVAESDALIEQLKRADLIVIGLPMYNFGVPSTLKAYFDHVARAGVTFQYTANGPKGLLTGKKAYVFATRGGRYAGTPGDLQTAYVRQFLGFLGINEVEFTYAEGLALGDEHRETALETARSRITQLAA